MLLFYVRHGDPIYNPDSLTPLGERQAEAVGKLLRNLRIDEVYASTSQRAKLTAKPFCEIAKKEMTLLDFANEIHAWRELTCISKAMGCQTWLFCAPEMKELFHTPEMIELGHKWYEHPVFNNEEFKDKDYASGIARIQAGADEFIESLGYKRVSDGKYEVLSHSDKRVALFAHQGFGLAFLSCVIGIPYPMFSTHFDICTTGVTVIEFNNDGGYSYPRILTLSSAAHLYKEGLPTRYN
jgi:probable phosphoglycerate mutase